MCVHVCVYINILNMCIYMYIYMYVCVFLSLSLFLSLYIHIYVYTCKKHSVCIVQISASIRMHGQHDVRMCFPTSNHMHEVARNRVVFHKRKPGRIELVNTLVSTPGRGFTGRI